MPPTRFSPRLFLSLLVVACYAPWCVAADDVIRLETEDTALAVRVIDGAPIVTSFVGRADGFEWVKAQPVPLPLVDSVEVRGARKAVRWHFTGIKGAAAGERSLMFACDDPALELQSVWLARPGPGPVEHRVILVNRGADVVLLPVQPSLALGVTVPKGHAVRQSWVEKGGGTPTAHGTHHDLLAPGAESIVRCWPSGHDDPRDAVPWTSVQDVEGQRGFYAGVEFTARVQLALRADDAPAGTSLVLSAGLSRDEKRAFVTRLNPGERFEAPPVFVGCYAGEVDDGANLLRKWVRANLVPPTPDARYPLLVNNSWGSGMAVDEPLARRMIDESADLGLELFHIDAGWFRTVGDWRPDPMKFPRGLAPVSDYAHAKGLKFGLWVGWTQGGDRTDPTGRHATLSPHDPAMADWFPQPFPKDWKAQEFTGATVCLAEPKAVDWCLASLRGIVAGAKLDLLEHDQIMVLDGCARDTHSHTLSPVDVGYRAALGYYHVYDTLRTENPNLLFENCVNGGRMVDYGALRRCHYISITDTYDPLSNRRAFYDASYALPPAACECYIENRAVRGLAQFKSMLRSGMMGWCTIMTDTTKWTPAQHDAAKQEFARYKDRLRPLIRGADLYHLTPRPDGVHWDSVEYHDPQSGRGALFAFRGKGGNADHTFNLKGLNPEKTYALTFADATRPAALVSGRELAAKGLAFSLAEPESSEIVFWEPK